MLKKDKIHLNRSILYIVIVIGLLVAVYIDYQRWLNPLGLKPEANPKQHDGSQEFQRPIEFESSVQPMPDEDGVRRYLDPWELHHHGQNGEPESKEISPKNSKDILVVPDLGLDR